jgi:hypothetical protein
MRNYWHDLSYDSIRATIRHIIFSVWWIKQSSVGNRQQLSSKFLVESSSHLAQSKSNLVELSSQQAESTKFPRKQSLGEISIFQIFCKTFDYI